MAYVNKSDIYKLFDESNGVIRLHIADVDMLPTADVVEVVRCKSCKYYENGKSYTPYCNNVMNLFEEMKPTDFCSYGEPKEKNDFKE